LLNAESRRQRRSRSQKEEHAEEGGKQKAKKIKYIRAKIKAKLEQKKISFSLNMKKIKKIVFLFFLKS